MGPEAFNQVAVERAYGTEAQRDITGVVELTKRLDAALGRARVVRENLGATANALFGPLPTNINDAANGPKSPDTLASLIDDLHGILTGIENHVARL